ncbi:MAG: DUF1549 domain-containing protein, partial [Bryobacteraceae bacterium]
MKRRLPVAGGISALLISGLLLSSAQEPDESQDPEIKSARDQIEANEQAVVEHAECGYFGPNRARFLTAREQENSPARRAIGRLTQNVTAQLSFASSGGSTRSFERKASLGTIDRFIFADIEAAGVTPAAKTTDSEFLRRATLDLTGRIPTADSVTAFLADGSADKRSKLVDDLLNRPEWADKWAMFFGDLYQNTVVKPSVNLNRFQPGRNAFWKSIKDSLTSNKPYDQMARELIVAQGSNSWTQGEINWVLGAWVINNPQQDNWDQAAANVAETFLGVGHMNCVLCHNGRGHLDALSLWGKSASRTEGYGLAAFFSRTTQVRQRLNNPDGTGNPNVYYWSQLDNPRMADYPLNTTTG